MNTKTWNCNLKLQKKYEYIESLNSDITTIQECEKLKKDYFPGMKYFWTGIDEKKGLEKTYKNYLDNFHKKIFMIQFFYER